MFESLKSLIRNKAFSNTIAKNRLQMVLVQDRSGLSPDEMDLFRKDLLEVISKYFIMEHKGLEIEWQRTTSATALVINTPITGRHKVTLVPRTAAVTS